jgi:hypothetical protein
MGVEEEAPLLDADLASIEDEPLTEESRAIAGPFGEQKDLEESAPLSLSLRGAGSEANGSDANGTPVRDMFSLKNHPAVLRHIVQKVRKARSRHNRGEGAKWAQARENKKHYKMKLVDKETIRDMVYLDDAMCRSVAHETWWEDEAGHVAEMTRLIPDWRHGYKKGLRDLDMVGPAAEVSEAPDLTGDDARIVSEDEEVPHTEPLDAWDALVAAEKPCVHLDMAGLKAEEEQKQQAEREVQDVERQAIHAANSARIDWQMAEEAASAVEEPVAPAPAEEAPTERVALVIVPPPTPPAIPVVYQPVEPDEAIVEHIWQECCATMDCDPVSGLAAAKEYEYDNEAAAIPVIDQNDNRSDQWLN